VTTITQVASAMQTLLTKTADQVARDCGFVKRERKLNGSGFAQALALGWMSNPSNAWEQIAAAAGQAGQGVTVQALHQRCGQKSAEFLQALLAEATKLVIAASPQAEGLLRRFTHAWAQDSTTLILPPVLQTIWPACGNGEQGGEAGMKLHLRLDLVSGQMLGPLPTDARTSDKNSPLHQDTPPPGSLLLEDMGYFQLSRKAQLSKDQVYWISGAQPQTAFFDAQGERLDLMAWLSRQQADLVDAPVQMGAEERLSCRLVAWRNSPEKVQRLRASVRKEAKRRGRVPSAAALAWCEWTVVVTNIPVALATAEEVAILKGLRWQIELLFKLWKSHAEIDEAHSRKPWIILTEIFAKVLAALIGHWMLLSTSWRPVARSLTKSWKTLRTMAGAVIQAIFRREGLVEVLEGLGRALDRTARIFRSRKQPRTHQKLRLAAGDP
jgi:hypothetical protein